MVITPVMPGNICFQFADLSCATGNAAVCSLLQQLMMLDVAQHGAIEKGCQVSTITNEITDLAISYV